MTNKANYLDLVISEVNTDSRLDLPRHFRRCTLSSVGDKQFINLQLPDHVQESILKAYESGKQVRIFA